METFKQFILENDEFIEIGNNIVVLKHKNKFIPYRRLKNKSLNPIRGFNKNGDLVWRTFKSIEELKQNLEILEILGESVSKKYKVIFYGMNLDTEEETSRTEYVSAKDKNEAYDKAWLNLKKKLGNGRFHFPDDEVIEI